MIIVKKTAEVYELRNGFEWGHIALLISDESVDVMINSDYGSYAYLWTHCGKNPKRFLCEIDMHYAMGKLTNGKIYEPDPDKYPNEIKRRIIGCRRDGNLDATGARAAWIELLGICDDYCKGDLLFHELIGSRWFEPVFGDSENLPNSERVRPQVSGFWDKIWTPFISELKRELSEKQVA